jgi:hypothetical protein
MQHCYGDIIVCDLIFTQRNQLFIGNTFYVSLGSHFAQDHLLNTVMAIVEKWLPPSRENWELICYIWQFFPIVSIRPTCEALCRNTASFVSAVPNMRKDYCGSMGSGLVPTGQDVD